jgi:hypothetical protein
MILGAKKNPKQYSTRINVVMVDNGQVSQIDLLTPILNSTSDFVARKLSLTQI